ncbi:hypothetical protein GCM10010199_24930 [Dactylosporangium roseum]
MFRLRLIADGADAALRNRHFLEAVESEAIPAEMCYPTTTNSLRLGKTGAVSIARSPGSFPCSLRPAFGAAELWRSTTPSGRQCELEWLAALKAS